MLALAWQGYVVGLDRDANSVAVATRYLAVAELLDDVILIQLDFFSLSPTQLLQQAAEKFGSPVRRV